MFPASDAKSFPLMVARQDVDSELSAVQAAPAAPKVHPGPAHGAHDGQRLWLDRIGIALSAVCAVHCALTPVLVAVAPFLFTSEFEFRTKAVLLSLATVALGWGYVTHRSLTPIVWLALGLTAFGVGEWVGHEEWMEIVATVLASLALILAHLSNARACRVSAPHGHGAPRPR